jgi:hypothetical protein
LSLLFSQLHKTSGAQVWRGSAATAAATGIFAFGWTFSWLWFGLSAWSLVILSWCALPWLAIGLLPELFCISRLRCSGVASCIWLGDNIAILSMEKQAHLFISNKLWTHTIFKQSNHWKIDWEVIC